MPQTIPKFTDWFRVGRRVSVAAGSGSPFPAVLLEDRGTIAAEGKHVVRVAIFPDDPEQRAEYEVSEDSIQLEPPPS
jgi:hypothetical protein